MDKEFKKKLQSIEYIAREVKLGNKLFVNRFYGIYKTFVNEKNLFLLELKLNGINRQLNNLAAEVNLLDAEKLAITAIIRKRLDELNK